MSLDDLDPALFAKSKPGKGSKVKDEEKSREIAEIEAQIYK